MSSSLPPATTHTVPSQPWAATPTRPERSRRRTVLLGSVACVVVGILVCAAGGATVLLTDVLRTSAEAVAAPADGQRPFEMPAEIGDLRQQQLVLAEAGDRTLVQRDRLEDATSRTVATLTRTYQAGADAAAYSDADLGTTVWAMVVRTEVPPPAVLPAGPTAEDLHLAAPPREVVTVGQVQCLVQNDTVPAGGALTPADRHVLSCQRGDTDRTVLTSFAGSQLTIESAAAWTDDAWRATAAM